METCGRCGRQVGMPCMSTRDMEDNNHPACKAALMAYGGGEYTVNRLEAGRWLRAMETAVSAEPETWAQPVTARHEPGSDDDRIFASLELAGFARREGSDGWRLTDRGMLAVTKQLPWNPA